MPERKESKTKPYLIPVRSIVANTNPRNPLSPELQKQGWTVFGTPDPTEGRMLWALATSDNPEERTTFVELMQQFDPDFVAWAGTFLTQGQLQAVEVRDNGKNAKGENTYTLVYGCRRCLAILYNWCLLGKPAEPVVEAKLVKGNNASLLHRAVVENQRKQPNPLEEAHAIKYAVNNGQSEEEVALEQGLSITTIKNRLALLGLPPEVQKKIAAGTLTATKALKEKVPPANGDGGKKPRLRSRKTIEEALEEFNPDTKEGKVLAWVLGRRDNFR